MRDWVITLALGCLVSVGCAPAGDTPSGTRADPHDQESAAGTPRAGTPRAGTPRAGTPRAGTVHSIDLTDLLEGDDEVRRRLADITSAPPWQVENWINGEPMSLSDLKGSIVVLDFWATWCGPCLNAVPHTNELYHKYRDQGVVILGVCSSRGAEKMAKTVAQYGIEYPVAADVDGTTVDAYRVNGYPDYYIIDRDGELRIADCRNAAVEEAIQRLLGEPSE